MNTQALATAALQLIDKVNVPATVENARAIVAIHEMLGAMARGELILSKPAAPTPPKE